MSLTTTKKVKDPVSELMRRFEIVEGQTVAWGWLEDGPDPTAPTIAAFNTFGTPNAKYPIPPRDTLTPTVQAVASAVSEVTAAAGRAAAAGRSSTGLLEGLALVIEFEHRAQIQAFADPMNARATIAGKGFNDPLVGRGDGGRILNGARAEVRPAAAD